jgi:signal transduction histidine kinase
MSIKRTILIIIPGVIFSLLPLKASPDTHIDSLVSQLRNVDDTSRIDLFNELSQLYWQRSFDTSLLYATHALNLAEKTEDRYRIAYSLNMTGNAYYMLSDYSNSLEYYQKALQLRTELGDSNDIAKTLNNIGAVHLQTRNYDQSLEYFEKALRIYSGLENDEIIFILTNNIGGVYNERKDYEKAFDYLNQAYEIARKTKNENNLIVTLNNMGEISVSLKQYDRALEYFLEAKELSEKINDLNMLSTILVNIGATYMSSGQQEKSLLFFEESLNYAVSINSISAKRDVYDNLYKFYRERNNPVKALEYLELYKEANDSINSEELRLRIKELELKYNAENFQNEIQLLKKDNEINKLSLIRSRIGIISLAIIILLSLAVFVINTKRIHQKREANELLTRKNEELETANRKLLESEKNLRELNTTKDKLFSIIGHDLRNPLNALLGFSELISGNTMDYSLEEIQKYNKIINESARNIHQLIENLLEWSRTQSGNIDFNPGMLNLSEITHEIQGVFSITARKKGITIHNNIQPSLQVYADKNLLSTILRNLINNALKFTYNGGHITLEADHTDGEVRIAVSDTGTGMTPEEVNQLFRLDANSIQAGTSEEKGTGLGLIICKEFIEMHNGEIWVETEPEKGSTFYFSLPDVQS